MDGLEEGEILESVTSDNEMDKQESKGSHMSSTITRPDNDLDAATAYRSGKVSVESSSESNSDVDEDSRIWKQKKQKFLRRSKEKQMDTRSSPTLPEYSNDQRPISSQLGIKKQNNIWGSVLEEQSLTQSMSKSVGVTQKNYIDFDCRTVESYDYRTRFKDTRPEITEPECKPNPSDLFEGDVGGTSGRSIIDYEDTVDTFKKQRQRGKKRRAEPDVKENEPKKGGIFDRLGAKRATTMTVGEIDVSEDMNKDELVKRIADFLHEPKVELIERVVETMGPSVAIRIVKMTRDVEHAGGMYTFDGSRKRTPGGVFIQLTKQQPEFTLEVKQLVFKEDCERQAEERKERRKKRKARKKKKKQSQGQDKNLNSRSSSKSGSRNSRSNSKSRSTSPMHDAKRTNEEKSDSDSEDSEDGRHGGKTTQEFNFETELAAARKKILDAKDKGNYCVEMEDDVDKENIQEVDDLDEDNVVDVLVEDASVD